jgi:hypothetical protein
MNKRLRLRERVVKWLGGVTRADLDQISRRAFEGGFEAGANDEPVIYDSSGQAMSTGYKSMESTPRDLSGISQEKAIEAAYRLWNTNPLAGALTEIMVDYIIGDGITVVAANEDVQRALDRFLQDPVNGLINEDGSVGEGLESLVRELGLFGEQLVLAFPRDGADIGMVADGLLRLGKVDPSQIKSIITDPGNQRDLIAVRLKDKHGGDDGPLYKIIRRDEAGGVLEGLRDLRKYREMVGRSIRPETESLRTVRGQEWLVCDVGGRIQVREADLKEFQADGECFLFQVNKISTGLRGRPDLLRMIDWLDRFDQIFFDGAEHVALLNMFAWDLKIEGGEEKAPEPERNLRMQAKTVSKMKPGSVYAHNEKAELTPKNPDLKTADLETMVRQLRVLIAGGARVPEHWVAEGGYTNRATASEMGKPTYKMLARRQGVVRGMLRKLCQYQIDVLVQLGQLPEEVDVLDEEGNPTETQPAREAFEIELADINETDTNMAASALATVAQAVLPMVASNLLTKKPALELVAAVASLLDVQLDVTKILEDAEGEGLSPETANSLNDLIDSLKNKGADNGQGPEDGAEEADPGE